MKPASGTSPSPAQKALVVDLFHRGRISDALRAAQALVCDYPEHAFGWNALGGALGHAGRLDEAVEALRRAIDLDPRNAEAHCNLGSALQKLAQAAEAELHIRQAIALVPRFTQAHNFLGAALHDLGRFDEALACFETALRIQPDYADALYNQGATLLHIGLLRRAEVSLRGALHLQPGFVGALSLLGNCLMQRGDIAQAQICYQSALGISADNPAVFSDYLFCRQYEDRPAAEMLDLARSFGQLVSSRVSRSNGPFTTWKCPLPATRLRVGFVSGDLYLHPVGIFLEAVMGKLSALRLDLFAYTTGNHADALTERLRPLFSQWRNLTGLDDESRARIIHDDAPHVLIDLSGHTGDNALPVFAWRPAPVQISWLGYFATTGVAEMDYILADRYCVPEGNRWHFTERVLYLEDSRLCFTRPGGDLPVSPLPSARNGFVTFCCFNNMAKLNDAVIDVWCDILRTVPSSRMLLKTKALAEAGTVQELAARFGGRGVDPRRLTLEGASPRHEYFMAYGRADIALDPFPYTGATTSMDALWMGVPVITLAGDRMAARQGVAIMTHAGLPDWIAKNCDQYLALAQSHARDLSALATVRSELRGRLQASPLLDAAGFARNLAAAVWRAHDERRQTLTPRENPAPS